MHINIPVRDTEDEDKNFPNQLRFPTSHLHAPTSARGGGICSDQNLILLGLDMCPSKGHEKTLGALSDPSLSQRQLHHHSLSEDISCPRVRSCTSTQSRLDFGSNVPPRDNFIHHHRHIEVNFFELRNLLRDSIIFLVQSHLIAKKSSCR